MNILKLISRKSNLFDEDLDINLGILDEKVSSSNFLVLGGSGSIE